MGPHRVHPELLRELPQVTMTSFLVIFAKSWQSGKFPEDLKTAEVTPFLKTGKKEALGSSELVSLASTTGKVAEETVMTYFQMLRTRMCLEVVSTGL